MRPWLGVNMSTSSSRASRAGSGVHLKSAGISMTPADACMWDRAFFPLPTKAAAPRNLVPRQFLKTTLLKGSGNGFGSFILLSSWVRYWVSEVVWIGCET